MWKRRVSRRSVSALVRIERAAPRRPGEARRRPLGALVTGTCQLAHLGRTTVVTVETGSVGGSFTGKSTYVAANGDRLYATVSGVSAFGVDGSLTNTGTVTVVGGTGRFVGARGTAAYFDLVHITGPTTAAGAYTLDGELVY